MKLPKSYSTNINGVLFVEEWAMFRRIVGVRKTTRGAQGRLQESLTVGPDVNLTTVAAVRINAVVATGQLGGIVMEMMLVRLRLSGVSGEEGYDHL